MNFGFVAHHSRRAFKYWTTSWLPAFVVSIAMAGFFIHQSLKLVELQEWLDHTDQAISKGLLIQKLVLDAETGIRGYLLASEPVMLDPYNSQNKIIDNTIADAKLFLNDNSDQLNRLERLSAAFDIWRAKAKDFVEGRFAAAEARVYFGSGDGRLLIDRCRQEIDAFLLEEQSLRESRSATLRIAIPRTIAGGAALTLFLRLLLSLTLRILADQKKRVTPAETSSSRK
jgi:CHASE3 domain sensor protein